MVSGFYAESKQQNGSVFNESAKLKGFVSYVGDITS